MQDDDSNLNPNPNPKLSQDDDSNLNPNPNPNPKLSQDDDSNLPLLFDEAFVLKLWLTGPLFLFMAHRIHFKVL